MRFVLLLALALLLPSDGAASGRRDHERARAALAAGEIRPLSELLSQIEARYLGRVIETELDRRRDRWVYEFKLLPPSGRIYELIVDAETGALLDSRGPVQTR